ncbi:MAG: hypothetical protein HYW77_02740 [Parcubacteria group bacterium]|nr:hypothetical protein [Parcubacteria group bacterium]
MKYTKNFKLWLSLLLIVMTFLGISSFANFRSPDIYDPDSFYHIRHSQIYGEKSIFYSDFPWAQYSIIKDLKADLWYGFHIFLLPFTYFSDLGLGIKVAGFFITLFVLGSFYFALRNLNISLPWLWSSFFVFSSPMILYRMAMTRPHPLSLGIFILIFSFIIKGPWWPLLIFGFLVSWIHSALFWFPLMIFAVVVVAKKIYHQEINLMKLGASAGGIIIGLFVRPNPVANLKLIFIQIVELYVSKKEVLDQIIGGELRSPSFKNVETYALLLVILLIIATILLGRIFYKKEVLAVNKKIVILSSGILTIVTLIMYMNANRAIDIAAAFIVIFSAMILSYYYELIKNKNYLSSFSKKTLNISVSLLFLFMIFTAYNSIKVSDKNFITNAKPRTTFKEPALWLKENTKEGEIVFHLGWSQFPILFFWNQHNYYINGMDPIFLYSYNPGLYWKAFYMLDKDTSGFTCGFINCEPKQMESIYDVLKNDFKVSYIFLRKVANPRFLDYVESDKNHFKKVYIDESNLIYTVL